MALKAVVLDIDGTLTNSQKEMTKKTRDALLKVQENGILLILASGRPTSGLIKFGKALDMDHHHGLFICFNGSKVIDCATNRVLYNQPISVEDSKAVFEHLKKFDVCPVVDKGEYMYVQDVFNNTIQYHGEPFNVLAFETRSNHYKICEIDDFTAWCDFEVNKILTYGDPDYLKAHYKEMMAPFKDRLNCLFTADFYFEYTANGIDKAKALEVALTPLGISGEEIIAFGDAQNDLSMLKFAGIGVAMENANEELKAIADEITLSNDEDGIAHSLYKHFPHLFQ